MPTKPHSVFTLLRLQQWRGVTNKQAYVPYLANRAYQLFHQWLDSLTPASPLALWNNNSVMTTLIDLCETGYQLAQLPPLVLADRLEPHWEAFLDCYEKHDTLANLELRKYSCLLMGTLVKTNQWEAFYALVGQHPHLLLYLNEYLPKEDNWPLAINLIPKVKEIQQTYSYLTNSVDMHIYSKFLSKNFDVIDNAVITLRQLLHLCTEGNLMVLASPQALSTFLEKANQPVVLFKLHLALCLLETAREENISVGVANNKTSLIDLHTVLSRYGHPQSSLYLLQHYATSNVRYCQRLAKYYAQLGLLQGNLSSEFKNYLISINKQKAYAEHNEKLQQLLRKLLQMLQDFQKQGLFPKEVMDTGYQYALTQALENLLSCLQQWIDESMYLLYNPKEIQIVLDLTYYYWELFREALQAQLPVASIPEALQYIANIEQVIEKFIIEIGSDLSTANEEKENKLRPAYISLWHYYKPYLTHLNQINEKLELDTPLHETLESEGATVEELLAVASSAYGLSPI